MSKIFPTMQESLKVLYPGYAYLCNMSKPQLDATAYTGLVLFYSRPIGFQKAECNSRVRISISVAWKRWLFIGIVTAVAAALLQIIGVLLQVSPEWNPNMDSIVIGVLDSLMFCASFSLSYAYFLHSAPHDNALAITLLVVGLVLSSLWGGLTYFFFPKALVAIFLFADVLGAPMAGSWLLEYRWRERREQKQMWELCGRCGPPP